MQQGVLALFEYGLQLPEQEALLLNQHVKITLERFSMWRDSGELGFRLVDYIQKYFNLEFCLKIPLVQMRISQIRAINRMDLFIFCLAVFPFFLAIL